MQNIASPQQVAHQHHAHVHDVLERLYELSHIVQALLKRGELLHKRRCGHIAVRVRRPALRRRHVRLGPTDGVLQRGGTC